MSTLNAEGLAKLLSHLSLSDASPHFAAVNTLSNPLDVLRTTLAELLTNLVGCDHEDAYKSIQWPNDIYSGDLSVTLPRLRPGCKPKELSSELVDEV